MDETSAAGDQARLPLRGIVVVALEQAVAAPFATRQLADVGARVIKVERRGAGDFARGYDRSVHGQYWPPAAAGARWTRRAVRCRPCCPRSPCQAGSPPWARSPPWASTTIPSAPSLGCPPILISGDEPALALREERELAGQVS